jgi:hypothetical protein
MKTIMKGIPVWIFIGIAIAILWVFGRNKTP